MFDLDLIEEDYNNNSFRLTEEEIIEIYRSEGVTLNKYYEELDNYRNNTHVNLGISAEEKMLRMICDDSFALEIEEQEKKLREQYQVPVKKYLSKEAQNKVVEGSLYLVFDASRGWYNFFEGIFPMEIIYYTSLEALMNSVKYLIHCERPVFRFYVSKSIERNIVKLLAKYKNVSYREAYSYFRDLYDDRKHNEILDLFTECESVEESKQPSTIFYYLRDKNYDVNYIQNVSSNEFMSDYNIAINNLEEIEKNIMQLSFDKSGNRGLTSKEIESYLGIEAKTISNIRKKAIKKLRKDVKLNTYRVN